MKTKIELIVKNADQVKMIQDPVNKGIVHIETLLLFTEAQKLKRGNANVRPPEIKKRPFRAMLATVETEPQLFHLKNRGITYICTNVNFDEENLSLQVTIPSEEGEESPRFGIADGGHTFEVINQTVQDAKDFDHMEKWSMPFVRVHFLVTKDQENVESIVESLNTSSQVQAYTLDEYQGKFEELKNALKDCEFDPELVAFRENEDKEWHVIEIVQRMTCFLKDRWVGTQPAGMYRSKGKALRLFTNEDTRREFRMLYDIIKDIVTLPEYIQSQFSKGGKISGKSLAKLKCVKALKRPTVRAGTTYASDHKIDMAGLLPIASGFRELLIKRGDRYQWRIPLKEVFEQCEKELYDLLVEKTAQVAASSQLANDVEFWAGCAAIVSRKRNDMVDEYPEKTIIRRHKNKHEDVEDGQAEEKQDEEILT